MGSRRISKGLLPIRTENESKGIRRRVLPSRTELVVKLPVKGGTTISEGITEKQEIQEGIYLAGVMTEVQGGYVITSIANTTSGEVEMDEPVLEMTEIEPGTGEPFQEETVGDRPPNRAQEVLQRLRLEHLNQEEREQVVRTCAAYRDIFHLPGEPLTSTTAVKHEIHMEPGIEPVNVKPYRQPETQNAEIRKQVEEMRRGGIITESNPPRTAISP
jgi:hypothetical protein